METNSNFTFLQGITMYIRVIITIDKNLFDIYLVNKGHNSRICDNKWGRCTERQNFSKLSFLSESNCGNNWGFFAQIQNFSKLSPLANSNCGDNLAKKFNTNFDSTSFGPFNWTNCCPGKKAGAPLKRSKMIISGYLHP